MTHNMSGDASEINGRLRVTHHGVAKNGTECAVLSDGRRGYVMRSLQRAIGMTGQNRVMQFRSFVADFAPNALMYMGETGYATEVSMPHGGVAKWVEAGILTELASGVIEAALDGRLGKRRAHLIAPCRELLKALGKTGEAALIDEATGYQYHRAPDALQDLFSRLIRETASDWEIRFHPEYYAALCKLFNFSYEGRHKALPPVIGKITNDWVYMVVFPTEIVEELRARRDSKDARAKLHQFLTGQGGLPLLEKQRDAVMMIARSSVDYRDFEARCSVAFYRPGHQTKMVFPSGANDKAA